MKPKASRQTDATDQQTDDAAEQTPYDFDFPIRRALRLGRVEHILGAQGIIQPPPSRQRLIEMITSGELEGKKVGAYWIVYEDSFQAWVRQLSGAE